MECDEDSYETRDGRYSPAGAGAGVNNNKTTYENKVTNNISIVHWFSFGPNSDEQEQASSVYVGDVDRCRLYNQ